MAKYQKIPKNLKSRNQILTNNTFGCLTTLSAKRKKCWLPRDWSLCHHCDPSEMMTGMHFLLSCMSNIYSDKGNILPQMSKNIHGF